MPDLPSNFVTLNFQSDRWPVGVALALLALTCSYKTCGYVLRRYVFLPKLTILADIPGVGGRRPRGRLSGKVVICGGSIAGLLAAAVCADHFEHVVIIEPDQWANEHGDEAPPEQPKLETTSLWNPPVHTRSKVAQYHGGHLIFPPVYMTLERLFPNFQEILREFGYKPAVFKIRYQAAGYAVRDPYPNAAPSDIDSGAPLTVSLTRPAFETLLRRLVKTSRNVEFRTGTVTGTVVKDPKTQSLGAVTVRKDATDTEEPADLIIDATGFSQGGLKWLRNAGFALPKNTRLEYNPHGNPTSVYWTITPYLKSVWPIPGGFQPGSALSVPPDSTTGETRSFNIGITENNILGITCGGNAYPPAVRSIQDIRAWAQGLFGVERLNPWLWELLDLLEEHQADCKPFYWTTNLGPMSWIKYSEAAQKNLLPSNFVVVGDAHMITNPMYGQGVYKATVDAVTLDAVLRRQTSLEQVRSSITTKLFEIVGPRLQGLWANTCASDYGYSTTTPCEGESLEDSAGMRNISHQMLLLARRDPEVWAALWHVVFGLAPRTDAMAPWILLRLARMRLFG